MRGTPVRTFRAGGASGGRGCDLRELITARRAELEALAEKLSQQLQQVRDELEELTVAEGVARRLAGQLHVEAEREATPTQAAGHVAGRAVLLVPQRERRRGPPLTGCHFSQDFRRPGGLREA